MKRRNRSYVIFTNGSTMIKQVKPPPAKRGRKGKRTPALIEAIIAKIEKGYPIDVSCATNGIDEIPYATFGVWCRDDKELRARVDGAILKAENMCLNPILHGIQNGDKEDSRWFLTHRYAHKYKTRVEDVPTNPNDGTDPTAELIAAITRGTKAHREKSVRKPR